MVLCTDKGTLCDCIGLFLALLIPRVEAAARIPRMLGVALALFCRVVAACLEETPYAIRTIALEVSIRVHSPQGGSLCCGVVYHYLSLRV
jgi:hypothetical protein